MKMQGVEWKGEGYVFAYEQETASEALPDYREVIICQMSDRIEELEQQLAAGRELGRRETEEEYGVSKLSKEIREITANLQQLQEESQKEGPCDFSFPCSEYHDKCQATADKLRELGRREGMESASEIERAARALVAKMPIVHEASMYVWHSAHIHYGPYIGPTYESELNELIKACAEANSEEGRQ